MAEEILFRVTVEADQATGELREIAREAQAATGKAKQAFQGLDKSLDSTTSTMRRTKASFRQTKVDTEKGITNPMAGAGAAISAAENSMRLFGSTAPSQLATVSSAMAALVASGLGPMTIGFTALTVAAGLAFQLFEEDETVDKLTERILSLRDAISATDQSFRALAAGVPVTEQGRREALELARSRVESIQGGVFGITANQAELARLRTIGMDQTGLFGLEGGTADRQRELTREITRQQEELRKFQEEVRNLERQGEQFERTEGLSGDPLGRGLRSRSLIDEIAGTLPGSRPPGLSAAGQGSRVGMDAQGASLIERLTGGPETPMGLSPAFQKILDDINAEVDKAFDEEQERLDALDKERQDGMARFRDLRDAEHNAELQRIADEIAARQAEQDARLEGVGEGLVGGIKSALLSPDLEDPIQQFADLFQRAISEAVLEGVIQGLGVREASADFFRTIGGGVRGTFSGSQGVAEANAGASSVDLATGTSQGPQKFVIVPSSTPDQTAQAMTTEGKRAIVADVLGDSGTSVPVAAF